MKSIRRDNCENEFFYELNCVENGEWIPEKITLEDTLVRELRFIWNHRYNLERRYIQQFLRSSAARWRFKRQQKEVAEGSFASSVYTAATGNLPPIPTKFGKLVSTEPQKTHGYRFYY